MTRFQSISSPEEVSTIRESMLSNVEMQACDDDHMGTLAERLTEAMNDLGWKKAELKRRAGLKSSSTLTELEKGAIRQSPQLPAIAAALGVEVLWLQHGKFPKKRTGASATPKLFGEFAMEAATIIDAMPENDQIEMIHYLRVDQAKRRLKKESSERLIGIPVDDSQKNDLPGR